jgi:hypothetical protein
MDDEVIGRASGAGSFKHSLLEADQLCWLKKTPGRLHDLLNSVSSSLANVITHKQEKPDNRAVTPIRLADRRPK